MSDTRVMGTGEFCAICGFRGSSELIPLLVEGHMFHLCPAHARELELGPPKTLAELSRSFGFVGLERRSGRDRRQSPGERPPAQERRHTPGRRLIDPR